MIDSLGEHSWTAVGQELRRIPDDCREKWRELKDPNVRTGPWSVEEDATLIFWVLKQSALARATDPEERNALMALRPEDASLLPEDTPLPTSGVMWSTIVTVMHRPHSVCRQRWYFSLLPRLNIGSARLAMQGLRWNRDEDLDLIDRMWSQGAEHLNEIDWTRCVSSTWPSAPHVSKHFNSLLTRLTSVRRYAPLAKADAPLDTILRKMRKHMSPAGDPEIFAMRTFSSSAQRRRRSYRSAMQVLAAREGENFAGAPPADEEAAGADGEKKQRGRKRRRRSGGLLAEEPANPDSAAMDPAEAAASAEEAARAERQRLRAEAASTAMAQALQAQEDKRRRVQEREEAAARAVIAVRERAEATERAVANRAAALQLYRPAAAAASSSSSSSPSSPQPVAVSSRANAATRSVASAAVAVPAVGGSSSETSEEEEEEQKRRPQPPRQRAHASAKLPPASPAATAAGAPVAAASSSSAGVRTTPRSTPSDKRARKTAGAAAARSTPTAAPKSEAIRLQPRW